MFHIPFGKNKIGLSARFLAKKYGTELQLKLSIDLGAVWRWFADDLDLLSRNPKVRRSMLPSGLGFIPPV